jgi:capsid protein
VQDWFATAWCQPIYELVIRQAILSGWFSGIVTADEFEDRSRDFLDTHWAGPVPRSINPTDDAKAAQLRVANGQTSPQIECAALGRQWQDVLSDTAEWIKACEVNGLPDWYIAQTLGLAKLPVPAIGAPADAEQTSEAA